MLNAILQEDNPVFCPASCLNGNATLLLGSLTSQIEEAITKMAQSGMEDVGRMFLGVMNYLGDQAHDGCLGALMAIVKCRNPKNGVVYVYSHERYFDEEQQKYRQRRRCIGKVDPETGETVPTGPRGRAPEAKEKTKSGSPEGEDQRYQTLLDKYEEAKARITELEQQLQTEKKEHAKCQKELEKLVAAVKQTVAAY